LACSLVRISQKTGPAEADLIAGQAKARKLTLVTHNTTAFQRVPD
jgi:predicted nucleic acid-binding protein